MAKKSIIARETKRKRLVAKYAAKRKALKEAGDYQALDLLPKNASPVRLKNRCATKILLFYVTHPKESENLKKSS